MYARKLMSVEFKFHIQSKLSIQSTRNFPQTTIKRLLYFLELNVCILGVGKLELIVNNNSKKLRSIIKSDQLELKTLRTIESFLKKQVLNQITECQPQNYSTHYFEGVSIKILWHPLVNL